MTYLSIIGGKGGIYVEAGDKLGEHYYISARCRSVMIEDREVDEGRYRISFGTATVLADRYRFDRRGWLRVEQASSSRPYIMVYHASDRCSE